MTRDPQIELPTVFYKLGWDGDHQLKINLTPTPLDRVKLLGVLMKAIVEQHKPVRILQIRETKKFHRLKKNYPIVITALFAACFSALAIFVYAWRQAEKKKEEAEQAEKTIRAEATTRTQVLADHVHLMAAEALGRRDNRSARRFLDLERGSGQEKVRIPPDLDDFATRHLTVRANHQTEIPEGSPTVVLAIAHSADGKLLATSGVDGFLRIWRLATQSRPGQNPDVELSNELVCQRKLEIDRVSEISARYLRFDRDGKSVLVGARNGMVLRCRSFGNDKTNVGQTEMEIVKIQGPPDGWSNGHSEAVAFAIDENCSRMAVSDQFGKFWMSKEGNWSKAFDHRVRGNGKKLSFGAVNALAFILDSKQDPHYVVTGGADGAVRIWDATTGKAHETLHLHHEAVNSVVVAPHNAGWWIASGSADQTIALNDFPRGSADGPSKPIVWHADSAAVNPIAFFGNDVKPFPVRLVSAGALDPPLFWTIEKNENAKSLALGENHPHGHWTAIDVIELPSADGQPGVAVVATGSTDGGVTLWRLESNRDLGHGGRRPGAENQRSLALKLGSLGDTPQAKLPDAPKHSSGQLEVSDAKGPKQPAAVGQHDESRMWQLSISKDTGPVWALAFSPDADGGPCRNWQLVSAHARGDIRLHRISYISDGNLGLQAISTELRSWDEAQADVAGKVNGGQPTDYKFPIAATSLAFSPDGKLLVAGFVDGGIDVAEVVDQNALEKARFSKPIERGSPKGYNSAVNSLAVGSREGTLHGLTVLADGKIHYWDNGLSQPALWGQVPAAEGFRCVGFNHDSSSVALGGDDGVLYWGADNKSANLMSFHQAGGSQAVSVRIRALCWHPTQPLVAYAGDDSVVRIHDVQSNTPWDEFNCRAGWVRSLAFSPDGKSLAVAANSSVQLLSVAPYAGNVLKGYRIGQRIVFRSFVSALNAVAFSPDGQLLAAGGWHGEISVWYAPNSIHGH